MKRIKKRGRLKENNKTQTFETALLGVTGEIICIDASEYKDTLDEF